MIGLLAVSGLMTLGGLIFTLVGLIPDKSEKSAFGPLFDYHSNGDILVPAGPLMLALGLLGLIVSGISFLL